MPNYEKDVYGYGFLVKSILPLANKAILGVFNGGFKIPILILFILFLLTSSIQAEPIELIASWYSIQSLKTEGTYKYSKGVMANGKQFNEQNLTAASRDFPLGTLLKITNILTRQSIVVKVTDRCNKRFQGKRIDLSKGAFAKIANLKSGIIPVKVEVLK